MRVAYIESAHGNSQPLVERLLAKIEIAPDGCWRFTGALRDGYGLIGISSGRSRGAHLVSYELLVGPIPLGRQLDHTCHTADLSCPGGSACLHRRCVNPDHLEPVTQTENVRRGRSPAAGYCKQTHCKRGHEFTPENTQINSAGSRVCRACRRIRAREKSQ